MGVRKTKKMKPEDDKHGFWASSLGPYPAQTTMKLVEHSEPGENDLLPSDFCEKEAVRRMKELAACTEYVYVSDEEALNDFPVAVELARLEKA